MKLTLRRLPEFNVDFDALYRWYLEQGGEELADRLLMASLVTLQLLAAHPEIGQLRAFSHPALRGLRSMRIARPFGKILIFYHVTNDSIEAWRLMHGARDLSRRLSEPPK